MINSCWLAGGKVYILYINIYIYRKEFSHDGARMYNEVYISVCLVTFYVSIMYLYCVYLCQMKIKKIPKNKNKQDLMINYYYFFLQFLTKGIKYIYCEYNNLVT